MSIRKVQPKYYGSRNTVRLLRTDLVKVCPGVEYEFVFAPGIFFINRYFACDAAIRATRRVEYRFGGAVIHEPTTVNSDTGRVGPVH